MSATRRPKTQTHPKSGHWAWSPSEASLAHLVHLCPKEILRKAPHCVILNSRASLIVFGALTMLLASELVDTDELRAHVFSRWSWNFTPGGALKKHPCITKEDNEAIERLGFDEQALMMVPECLREEGDRLENEAKSAPPPVREPTPEVQTESPPIETRNLDRRSMSKQSKPKPTKSATFSRPLMAPPEAKSTQTGNKTSTALPQTQKDSASTTLETGPPLPTTLIESQPSQTINPRQTSLPRFYTYRHQVSAEWKQCKKCEANPRTVSHNMYKSQCEDCSRRYLVW